MANKIVELVSGDSTRIEFTFLDKKTGIKIDLTGAISVKFYWSIESGAVVSKDMVVTDAVNGLAYVEFAANELNLPSGTRIIDGVKYGSLRGETELVNASSKKFTRCHIFEARIRSRIA